MSDALKLILAKVAESNSLTTEEAERAFDIIMSGDALESQIGAFLMALRVRGETVDEITGAVRIMRAKATTIEAPDGAVVVTRDARGRVHCGRLSGDYRRDDTAEARDVDLVHVRPCAWAAEPLDDAEIPPAVRQTFARGGKNWQRVHDRGAETLLAAWWASR